MSVGRSRTRLAVCLGVDWFLTLAGLPLAVSSFLLWVVFPRGYYLSRTLWVAIHKWSGLAFGVLAVVHLAMHMPTLLRATRAFVQRPRRER